MLTLVATLEHISKPLSGLLKPGIVRLDYYGGDVGVKAQSYPVWQVSPDEHFSLLLDDEGERVGHEPRAHFFRQRSDGVKTGARKGMTVVMMPMVWPTSRKKVTNLG